MGDLASSTDEKAILWPNNGVLTLEWMRSLAKALDYASRNVPPSQLSQILLPDTLEAILLAAYKILHKEPNIIELHPEQLKDATVTLVGDVHGQYHDVLRLFEQAGEPNENSFFVFNGDYVDRGAWGTETYALLLAWKVFLPQRVFLLRGNHETKFCSSAYGFEKELTFKYPCNYRHLFRKILACFESHPLSALISNSVFICHGGLFRDPNQTTKKSKSNGQGCINPKKGKKKRKSGNFDIRLGKLNDVANCRRGLLDPVSSGPNAIVADMLWSDPGMSSGLKPNLVRGIGLLYGPDCTQKFLEENNLKMVVRSHEGPDAREKRREMQPMSKGWAIDHEVKNGMLVTLFSAPDYPQFQDEKKRTNNKAAFIVLKSPDYSKPNFFEFEAVKPRPKVSGPMLSTKSTPRSSLVAKFCKFCERLFKK